jgi:hypothetical protein
MMTGSLDPARLRAARIVRQNVRIDPYSRGARAIGIALRAAHLGAMALLVGGRVLAPAHASLHTWQILTAATGAGLLLSEASHSRHWVYQGRGLIALGHVALAGLASVVGGDAAMAALLVGAVGSHLPGAVRKWSLRHGRVVD